jgi:acetyltransferase-like isoleucine patch superfamily enzyme
MKAANKKIIHILSMLLVSPLIIAHILVQLLRKEGIFIFATQLLSIVPGKLGSYLRISFNRVAMTYCDMETVIGFATLFSQTDTEINKGVYIGPQCNIGMCSIGKNTLIASGVHIMSGSKQHTTADLDTPIKEQGGVFEKVIIGEDCWVGNGALIMANVGDKCIVGAGSVVTKDIPDYSIVAGNPAKIIRNRKDN